MAGEGGRVSHHSSLVREMERAIKKAEIAIDKVVGIKDLGYGCDETERALELLNALLFKLREKCSWRSS